MKGRFTSIMSTPMTGTTTITNLARLLQLASPTLPVGAYSYSQGLEAAVEARIVNDAASAQRWIGDVLEFSMAKMEAPLFLRMCRAWQEGLDLGPLNVLFLASRETAELRAETLQMGYSLGELLPRLGLKEIDLPEISFPAAFSFAVAAWKIDSAAALAAYLWAWLENQVMAAVKAVPLGKSDGQRILLALGERLFRVAQEASSMKDDQLGNFAPGLAVLSSRHETQYSRLFRS